MSVNWPKMIADIAARTNQSIDIVELHLKAGHVYVETVIGWHWECHCE